MKRTEGASIRLHAWGKLPSLTLVLAAGAALHSVRAAMAQCEVGQVAGEPGPKGDNDFGRAVSIWGDVAAVGDPAGLNALGSVRIFRYDGGRWQFVQELVSPSPQNQDLFGKAVSLRADVLAVGNPAQDTKRGAVDVFVWERVSWVHSVTLLASDGDAGDDFGFSVSLDEDTVLVGARGDENDGRFQTGSAYVFRHSAGTWLEEAKLTDPNGVGEDGLGQSVAIRGDVAVVGGHGNDPDGLSAAGAAFVFRRHNDGWGFEQEIHASKPSLAAWFGWSVAMTRERIVVGAPGTTIQVGAAHVFVKDGEVWREEACLEAARPVGAPNLGRSVALAADGETILVGAHRDSEAGSTAGAAHVFRLLDGRWVEVAKLTASDAQPADLLGQSVSLSGDRGIVGATGNNGLGAAYVFGGFAGDDCNDNNTPDSCDILEGKSVDRNGDGVPDECAPPADVDGDGLVGLSDLVAVITKWGSCPQPCPPACPADVNGDCQVDVADLVMVVLNWT